MPSLLKRRKSQNSSLTSLKRGKILISRLRKRKLIGKKTIHRLVAELVE